MAPIYEVSNDDAPFAERLGFQRRNDLETQSQRVELDTKNWIALPQEFSGLDYPLSIDPARISYNSAVEIAEKNLGLDLENTSRDSLGREFIGDINHSEALKLNEIMGNKTLSLIEARSFLNLLYQGMQGKIEVYTEKGERLKEEYLQKIFEDITKVQSPWRAEWLDCFFEQREDLFVKYHVFEDGKVVQKSEKLDKNTLMQDKTPGISLEGWLENPTQEGLPPKKIKEGSLFYWAPVNNRVAGFGAYSGGAGLGCDGDPSVRGSDLGVRAAKQLK